MRHALHVLHTHLTRRVIADNTRTLLGIRRAADATVAPMTAVIADAAVARTTVAAAMATADSAAAVRCVWGGEQPLYPSKRLHSRVHVKVR